MERRGFLGLVFAPVVARLLPLLPTTPDYIWRAWTARPVTIGAIDQATFVFWRNQSLSGAAPSVTHDALSAAFAKCHTEQLRGINSDLFADGANLPTRMTAVDWPDDEDY